MIGKVIFSTIILGTVYSAATTANFISKKKSALSRALELVNNKGMVNLGAGCKRTTFAEYVCNLEQVKINVDIAGVPEMLYIDLELGSLPFEDKEFDVAFASHVLEHLNNWQGALDEWSRIADHVILTLPHPLEISGWLNPNHKQHFSPSDRDYITSHWLTVEIFA